MKKLIAGTLLILFIIPIITGCSVRYKVNTDSTKTLVKELKGISDTIKSVEITFMRPAVTFRVSMTEEPTQEILDSILLKVKSYTSVDNMDEIAGKVRWKLRVSQVYLTINTDKDEFIEHEYFASYFKTASTEETEENIDAYQTWRKSEIIN